MKEIEELKQTLDNLIDSSSDLDILLEFEEVLDNLNLYAYKNWEHGEVIAGPEVSKYWITVTLMWPRKLMPDPDVSFKKVAEEISKDQSNCYTRRFRRS